MDQFRVFCESLPRQILLLGLPVISGAATGTHVLQFDKKPGALHTSFNHQRSTTSPVKRKNVCKSIAWLDGANLKAHIASRAFPREIPVRGRFFFERRFQPLSVGGVFSNQRESISWCPKSQFPSKTQNRQIARTSPWRLSVWLRFLSF